MINVIIPCFIDIHPQRFRLSAVVKVDLRVTAQVGVLRVGITGRTSFLFVSLFDGTCQVVDPECRFPEAARHCDAWWKGLRPTLATMQSVYAWPNPDPPSPTCITDLELNR